MPFSSGFLGDKLHCLLYVRSLITCLSEPFQAQLTALPTHAPSSKGILDFSLWPGQNKPLSCSRDFTPAVPFPCFVSLSPDFLCLASPSASWWLPQGFCSNSSRQRSSSHLCVFTAFCPWLYPSTSCIVKSFMCLQCLTPLSVCKLFGGQDCGLIINESRCSCFCHWPRYRGN